MRGLSTKLGGGLGRPGRISVVEKAAELTIVRGEWFCCHTVLTVLLFYLHI